MFETRTIEVYGQPPELRTERSAKGRRLIGYAARFNSLSKDLGGFRERILPGAFDASLSGGKDIRALYHHESALILGRTSAGTLHLSQDATGLAFAIDMPDTTYARDLEALIERGDVRGMSFGFKVPKGGDRFTREGGESIRELPNIDLKELTVTSIPAYEGTNVSLRVAPDLASRFSSAGMSVDLARLRLELL